MANELITWTELLQIIERNVEINRDVRNSLNNLEIYIKELPAKIQDDKYKEALSQIDKIYDQIRQFEGEGVLKNKIDQIVIIKEKLSILESLTDIKTKVESTHSWTTSRLPLILGSLLLLFQAASFLISNIMLNSSLASSIKPFVDIVPKLIPLIDKIPVK